MSTAGPLSCPELDLLKDPCFNCTFFFFSQMNILTLPIILTHQNYDVNNNLLKFCVSVNNTIETPDTKYDTFYFNIYGNKFPNIPRNIPGFPQF